MVILREEEGEERIPHGLNSWKLASHHVLPWKKEELRTGKRNGGKKEARKEICSEEGAGARQGAGGVGKRRPHPAEPELQGGGAALAGGVRGRGEAGVQAGRPRRGP